uniref:DNA repair protein REV1 n=1 Tax=Rhabditophanes sp. KR3021 TaxID=114890 RepID=A0AC35TPY8_9BILA
MELPKDMRMKVINEDFTRGWNNYMKDKIDKLIKQCNTPRYGQTQISVLFEGISIAINGETMPSNLDIRNIFVSHGGTYHPYFLKDTTLLIASNYAKEKVRNVAKGQLILHPNWILHSVAKNELANVDHYTIVDKQIKKSNDATFISEYYGKSRLHLISSLGQQLKGWVLEERKKANLNFPARSLLQHLRGHKSGRQSVKLVCHIDMDCFFVSVGIRNKPHLKGKPIIVTHSSTRQNSNAVVASCSYEARKFNILNGMVVSEAMSRCPHLHKIPYEFDEYCRVSKLLYQVIASFTLDIQGVSCDEMFVDFSDLCNEMGIVKLDEFIEVVRKEVVDVTGCECSVGMGENMLVARLATRKAKPNGQFMPTNVESFMESVKLGDLPGFGKALIDKIEASYGEVKVCGDVLSKSVDSFKKVVGEGRGKRLYEWVRGFDSRNVLDLVERKSVSCDINYGIRMTSYKEICEFMTNMARELVSKLKDINKSANKITLKLMIRSPDASREGAKYMGHGVCDTISKTLNLNGATNVEGTVQMNLIKAFNYLNPVVSDVRGISGQLTGLEDYSQRHGMSIKAFLPKAGQVKVAVKRKLREIECIRICDSDEEEETPATVANADDDCVIIDEIIRPKIAIIEKPKIAPVQPIVKKKEKVGKKKKSKEELQKMEEYKELEIKMEKYRKRLLKPSFCVTKYEEKWFNRILELLRFLVEKQDIYSIEEFVFCFESNMSGEWNAEINKIKAAVNELLMTKMNAIMFTLTDEGMFSYLFYNDLVGLKTLVFDQISERLKKEVKIFCIVLTGRDYKYSRDIPLKNTWLKRCNSYIFASSVNDPTLPSIKFHDKHGYEFSYHKIRRAFKYVYEKYGNDYDWFYKVDNDSFSLMENLRMFLLKKNPKEAKEYYGFRIIFRDRDIKEGYMAGGVGYVFSKASLKKLVTKGFPNTSICRPLQPALEDMEIGQCFARLNIKGANSVDNRQRHLFIPGNVEEFTSPTANAHRKMFRKFSMVPIGSRMSSLGRYPIAFHYVSPKMMYSLNYLFYKAKVAGMSSKIFNLYDDQKIEDKIEEGVVSPILPPPIDPTVKTQTSPVATTTKAALPPVAITTKAALPPVATTTKDALPPVTITKLIPTTVTNAPVKATTTVPHPPPNNNPLNLHTPAPLQNASPERTAAYANIVSHLMGNLNLTADPCVDFYTYSCSNIQTPMSFDSLDAKNVKMMADKIKEDGYITDQSALPLQQLKSYFSACQNFYTNKAAFVDDGTLISKIFNDAANKINVKFPMFETNEVVTFPDAKEFGRLLGYLSGTQSIETLISTVVDTNWEQPNHGYSLFIDQSILFYENTVYTKAWDYYKADYKETAYRLLITLKDDLIKDVWNDQISKDIDDILEMELTIATLLTTDDTTRRNYKRSYNPMTVNDANTQFPRIDFYSYLTEALAYAPDQIRNKINQQDSSFKVVIMEPQILKKISAAFSDNNPYKFTPRTFYNYLYFRVILANAKFFPTTLEHDIRKLDSIRDDHPPKRRGISIPSRQSISRKDDADYSKKCASLSVDDIQYANARVFIDALYPTTDDVTQIRNNVGTLANSILAGFQGMLDGLDWMTLNTKASAYLKINDLVKNIAFPDFIADDGQLSSYYQMLQIKSTDQYYDMLVKIGSFNKYNNFNYLTMNQTNRIDFLSTPSTVNAWYQPELNSITFPAAILQEPFYSPYFPASVNYGSFGGIIGHELTHAFDDEGVQWNGEGKLSTWMDAFSGVAFKKMAACVIAEYSAFCYPSLGMCVDGEQTQGENIADSGGLNAAYASFNSYVAFNGPDPVLDDPLLSQFTHDQLFFLSFAQVWCQTPDSDATIRQQILRDPHSPSNRRVEGTIHNHPAFKKAFSCPDKSPETPEKHCNVWVSNVASSYGLPKDTPIVPDLSIPTPAVESPTNVAYESYSKLLENSIDLTKDPCNNFYEYSCNNFKGQVSINSMNLNNLVTIAKSLKTPSDKDILPIKQIKDVFTTCVAYATSPDKPVKDHQKAVDNFNVAKVALQNTPFPLFDGPKSVVVPKTLTTNLPKMLGELYSTLGLNSLVSFGIDTNWKDPGRDGVPSTNPYLIYLDQPSLYYDYTYYTDIAWEDTKKSYRPQIIQYTKAMSTLMKVVLTDDQLGAFADDMMSYEKSFATDFLVSDDIRRANEPMYNLMKVKQASIDYGFDFKTYLNSATKQNAAVVALVNDDNYPFILNEMDQFGLLQFYISTLSQHDADRLANYLYFRVIMNNQNLVGDLIDFDKINVREKILPVFQPSLGRTRPYQKMTTKEMLKDLSGQDIIEVNCAEDTVNYMQYANGRVFIDALYPTEESRQSLKNDAGKLVNSVLTAFRTMIDGLSWMTPVTKASVYLKIENVQVNIGWPDFIAKDDALIKYYAALQLPPTKDYLAYIDKLNSFNFYLQGQYLTVQHQVDRTDFSASPSITNAWYQPQLNSITIPSGILQENFYSPDYNMANNFGAIGIVVGHELTHGFDDGGVQWNEYGELTPLMDDQSTIGFNEMAQCVIDQYDTFCPLNNTGYEPSCINGYQTQGENIADNGGIRSSWRAMHDYMNFNGADKKLPGAFASQFTEQQLFFLSLGQIWCTKPISHDDIYSSLLTDPHSLPYARVTGSVQNFPAFRNAFNCPLGSVDAPINHCNVWVTDIAPRT